MAAVNLYLPQWIWALPGLILARLGSPLLSRSPHPGRARYGRVYAVTCCLMVGWVAGPIMGFQWTGGAAAPAGDHVRLMTYNIKWCLRGVGVIASEVKKNSPDILLMQDANASESKIDTLRAVLAYRYWIVSGQYIVASRFPLVDQGVRSIAVDGYPFEFLRCRTIVDGHTVTIFDIHLFTPRGGLTALFHGSSDGVRQFQANVVDRLYQSAAVSQNAELEHGPLIIAGDCNAPIQSLVCKVIEQTGLVDVFTRAGRGYGYTYGGFPTHRFSFVRIDHIFVSPDWSPQRCWTGSSDGSEHRPVVCDMVLKRPTTE